MPGSSDKFLLSLTVHCYTVLYLYILYTQKSAGTIIPRTANIRRYSIMCTATFFQSYLPNAASVRLYEEKKKTKNK